MKLGWPSFSLRSMDSIYRFVLNRFLSLHSQTIFLAKILVYGHNATQLFTQEMNS
jgi:hypothetical protein